MVKIKYTMDYIMSLKCKPCREKLLREYYKYDYREKPRPSRVIPTKRSDS